MANDKAVKALKKVLLVVKETEQKRKELKLEKFDAVDADMDKALKAMGYQQILEIVKGVSSNAKQ